MKSGWRIALFAIFLIGLFAVGLVGTSTAMTFIWPAYSILGLAGVLMVATIFQGATFRLPLWTSVSIFALGFYLLLRASDSPVAYFAREDAALIVASFLVYAGVLGCCGTARRRNFLLLSLVGLVALNLVFALLQTVVGPEIWVVPGYERTSTSGVGGLFNQSNHYAAFLAVLVPVWFSLAVFGRGSALLRKLWGAIGFLSIGGVLFSRSFAGGVTLAVGLGAFTILAAFLLWRRLKPSVRRSASATFGIVAVLGAGLLYLSSERIAGKLGYGLLTKNGEASLPLLWESGVRQFLESPLLGTGSRSSYLYSRMYRSEALSSGVGETEFVHNEFLQIAADYGAIALLLVALVLLLHARSGLGFVSGYREYRPVRGELIPRSDHLAVALGTLAAMTSLITVCGFDFVMHLPAFAVLGATLLALLAAPDPMADALGARQRESVLPGGGTFFATRSVAFGCGIAMLLFGAFFSRSEYHYEQARLAFERNEKDFRLLRNLKAARELDPQNPFAQSLSAHAMVAGITTEMANPARRQALEQADRYFSAGRALYPQDVFAAVGHAAVLDELGKRSAARERIEDAQQWAPLYGNLMQAKGELALRSGKIQEAEESFRGALVASAFRDMDGAEQGLRTISEWKFIAQQNGIDWKAVEEESKPDSREERRPREAVVRERDVAGGAIPDPAAFAAPASAAPTGEGEVSAPTE